MDNCNCRDLRIVMLKKDYCSALQMTLSIMAEGEPVKSGGKLEARLDLFPLTDMYLHLALFRVMEF